MAKVFKRKQTIMTAQNFVRASIRPNSFNEEDRTIELEFASEYPVERYSWRNDEYYDEVLEISTKAIDFGRMNSGASILKDHTRSVDKVVGITISARIEGNLAVAVVRLHEDEDDPDTTRFVKKVRDGIIKNVSVGYSISEITRIPPKTKNANPEYRATRWEPNEISFVAIGADPFAKARNKEEIKAEALKQRNSNNLHKTTIIRMDEDEEILIDDEQDEEEEQSRQKTKKKRSTQTPKPEPKGVSAEELRTILKEERQRNAQIRTIGEKFGMKAEFINKHIDEETPLDEYRQAVMEAWEAGDPGKGVRNENKMELKKDERDKLIKVRSTGLAVRAGIIELDSIKDDELRSLAAKEQKHGLYRMAERSLRAAGEDTDDWSPAEVARRSIAPQATGQFPEVMNALVNTIYMQKYQEEEDNAWREISVPGTLSDFKDYGAIRSWGLDNLVRVGETEEYTQIPLRDAQGERMRLFKHGGIISLSWEAIVNDDFGHFTSLISDLGISAGRTLKDEFWKKFLDNGQRGPLMADSKALYHVDHNNLMTPEATLNEAAIDKIRIHMKTAKKDLNGKTIAFRPSILLVNPIEFSIARRYNNSTVSVDAQNRSSLLESLVAGTFDKIIESESIPAGYRYVFDKPSRNPVMRVNYLDGERAPVIERHDEFRTDSINWKARYVFGISGVSYQATALLPNA